MSQHNGKIVDWDVKHQQKLKMHVLAPLIQGSQRLEKYLNLEGFLEKSLKIKYALKSTGKLLKGLEKSLNSFFCRTWHS